MIGLEIRDTKEDDDLMVATVSTNLDLDDNAMIQKNITTFDRFSSTYQSQKRTFAKIHNQGEGSLKALQHIQHDSDGISKTDRQYNQQT